jgi:hypothetical protein
MATDIIYSDADIRVFWQMQFGLNPSKCSATCCRNHGKEGLPFEKNRWLDWLR